MCHFMGLPAFAPDALLRFQLRTALKRITSDDKDILWEGVDALTDAECRAALRARGIPFTGLSPEQMRSGLSEWVQLSMNKEVPMVMMMMSNMYRFARVRRDQSEEDTQKPVKARIGISHIPTFPYLTPHIPSAQARIGIAEAAPAAAVASEEGAKAIDLRAAQARRPTTPHAHAHAWPAIHHVSRVSHAI